MGRGVLGIKHHAACDVLVELTAVNGEGNLSGDAVFVIAVIGVTGYSFADDAVARDQNAVERAIVDGDGAVAGRFNILLFAGQTGDGRAAGDAGVVEGTAVDHDVGAGEGLVQRDLTAEFRGSERA